MIRDDITDADVQMVLAVDRVRHATNDGCTADGVREALQQGFWPIDEYRAIAALARQETQDALAAAQRELAEARDALAAIGVEYIEGEWCYTSTNGETPAPSLRDAVVKQANLPDLDMEQELAEARAWIDKAVASCNRRQCGMMERHLAEARADLAAVEAKNAELREVVQYTHDMLDGTGDALRDDGFRILPELTDDLVARAKRALLAREADDATR